MIEVHILQGESGSGKTSALKALCGLLCNNLEILFPTNVKDISCILQKDNKTIGINSAGDNQETAARTEELIKRGCKTIFAPRVKQEVSRKNIYWLF
jgi:ABC-type sulfate/molybdate transport systems ATPase subunit